MHEQPRVTDFIPTRYRTFALLTSLGLVAVAGLEGLHAWMPSLSASVPELRLASFDLQGRGSLAGWFSALLLMLCAATAMLIFSIRRHRADDYQGRYRVWLWLAICCSMMSISSVAGLHAIFQQLMIHFTGKHLVGDGSIYWVGAWAIVLLATGIRLVLDILPSRGIVAVLGLSFVLWAVAGIVELGGLPLPADIAVMVGSGCHLVGALCLLLALGLQARHAILEAEGKLPTRTPKAKKESKKKDKEKPAAKLPANSKVDPPHKDAASDKRSDLQPHHTPAKPGKAPVVNEDDDYDDADYDDEDDDDNGDRKQSTRADRKKLRKLKADERRAGLR